MRSAFYSRNNSYSRSANAEAAENQGRLPRIRAAKELEISVKAFDAGCQAIGYVATEWHHVGKYANRVDYYDTVKLGMNIKFWQGSRTKANAAIIKEKIQSLIRLHWQERLTPPEPVKSPKFNTALKKICEGKGNMLEQLQGFRGYSSTTFQLTPENIASKIREISLRKFEMFKKFRQPKIKPSVSSFSRENVVRIINRNVKFTEIKSLVDCTPADNYAAGLIVQKLWSGKFEVEFKNGGAYIRQRPTA